MFQVLVDPKEGGLDILKESVGQKLLAGHLLTKYVVLTQSEIDTAVANVPPGNNTRYPKLSMSGTDLEAEQAIDTLLQKSTQETEQTLETMQTLGNATDSVDLLSGSLDLSAKVTLLASPATGPGAPATVSLAAFLENLSKIMDVFVLALQGTTSYIGVSHHNQLTHYAVNSADIAFDPSKLNLVLAQENRIINLDIASFDFVPANYIPAGLYYSRYQEQTIASVDDYKASIERLMQTIAGGQDDQIRAAAEELLRVDDDLRGSLKIAEAPLNEMPFDRPEVQNLDFSVQDLRAQSVTLHVALATYMVEKTSPEIQQETQTIIADVLKSADNFKVSYDVLAQSGLAIPVKFLPVILDAKTPDTIVKDDTFSMKIKISNVGQISQQSPVTLSVAGGDKVEAPDNQPLPEITPNSQIEIPVNLKAVADGNQFITVELIQDGGVIASKIVYLEIGKSSNSFSLPPTSYLIGGGLGLLCLAILAIGGVFVYTRTRKPKRAPAKPVSRPQAPKPVSGSAEQIKRAIELAKSKRHKEAFEILRGIVQSEPNNASAWFNLGGVLASMGNYKDSERCYSRAKRLGHPRADDALNWLSQNHK
jgi:tetratricopeptide (TPR) repeat protein